MRFTHRFEGVLRQCEARCQLHKPHRLGETSAVAKEPQGVQRIRSIRNTLNSMGLQRSQVQQQFHEAFIQCCAQHLFCDDQVDMGQIMSAYNWKHIKQSCLTLTPRRFGKTTSVAMYVGAYALCVPNSETCVFSTGKRASTKMLELIASLVVAAPGGAERIVKQNAEQLWVSGSGPADVRKISSYPSAVSTLRGVGGNLLILEEAAFIDTQLFLEVVVPLLQMQTCSLIAISTPQSGSNYYSELFTLKGPDNKPFFTTIRVGMACKVCEAKGLADSCTHQAAVRPPWQSEEKADLMQALYGSRTDLLNREVKGLITDNKDAVYEQAGVDRAMQRELVVDRNAVHSALIACDPNGGGTSEMCLITLTFYQGNLTVLAMDAEAVRGHDEIRALLIKHVNAVLRTYPNAQVALAVENNLGNEASHMREMMRKHQRVKCLYEHAGLAGVRTTAARKELFVGELERHFATNTLGFAAGLLGKGKKDTLRTQLLNFKKITRTNVRGMTTFSYTGKGAGPDDMALTLSLGAYWLVQLMQGRVQTT